MEVEAKNPVKKNCGYMLLPLHFHTVNMIEYTSNMQRAHDYYKQYAVM